VDSEDRLFDVWVRRQFRIGSFNVALDAAGSGYRPRALLRIRRYELTLTRVGERGKPIQASSVFPKSWTWRLGQVVNAQKFVLGSMGWGVLPSEVWDSAG